MSAIKHNLGGKFERREIQLPTARPARPRTSSAMSGFRFCGMIEDPVVIDSGNETHPNSGDDHSTNSCAIRLKSSIVNATTCSASST